MREKGQEALDRRRDAGADLGDALSDIGDDRSRARRLFEVIRQAVKDFYVTFLSRLARWFDSLPIFPP
jgi:transposase